MVVLSVTRCPPQLRGDLTKWFIEIDIGVYVGKVSARVREKVWSRVCDNIKKGKFRAGISDINAQYKLDTGRLRRNLADAKNESCKRKCIV